MEDSSTVNTVDRLEESDYLRLLLANRDIDLLETQIELLKSRLEKSRVTLNVVSASLQKKYSLLPADVVDINDGVIKRAPRSDSVHE